MKEKGLLVSTGDDGKVVVTSQNNPNTAVEIALLEDGRLQITSDTASLTYQTGGSQPVVFVQGAKGQKRKK